MVRSEPGAILPGARAVAGDTRRRLPWYELRGSYKAKCDDWITIMLTDRYELPLSTNSSAARDAYLEGCEAKLTMYPGAIEAFDRAIAADPSFALAHAAKAYALLERGNAVAARASMAAANSLTANLSPAGSQPYRVFRLARGGRRRRRTFSGARAP